MYPTAYVLMKDSWGTRFAMGDRHGEYQQAVRAAQSIADRSGDVVTLYSEYSDGERVRYATFRKQGRPAE